MQNNANFLFQSAEFLRESMQVREAIYQYGDAERAGYAPDQCSAARWTCYMLAGEWELAWRESDAITRRGGEDAHAYWDGSSWAGKDVLIRCLHGLGDTLQFIRYASLVRSTARSITIEAQPTLKAILQEARLADNVITWGEPEPAWEVQLEVNELPRAFRATPKSVPNRGPYLLIPGMSTDQSLAVQKPLKVGLIWRASDFDRRRNVPFSALEPLLALAGISFFSLQMGESYDDDLPNGLVKLLGREPTVLETASQMAGLDLILTVDTMTAHLAGALGRRTWTMLQFQCDWRWMVGREDTPWYPTMRLFRQSAPGDWEPVIEQVRLALWELSSCRELAVPDYLLSRRSD